MEEEPTEIPLLQIDESVAELQHERLSKLRSTRDGARVEATLKALADGAREGQNTMPLLAGMHARIRDAGRDVRRAQAGLRRVPRAYVLMLEKKEVIYGYC